MQTFLSRFGLKGMAVFLGLIFSLICVPMISAANLNRFAQNKNGQTYGNTIKNDNESVPAIPDLVSAIGIDGTIGYVYSTDLNSGIIIPDIDKLVKDMKDSTSIKTTDVNEFIANVNENISKDRISISESEQTSNIRTSNIISWDKEDSNRVIYRKDLHKYQILPAKSPHEAELYMEVYETLVSEAKANGDEYMYYIPLYESDGETVIGEFGMSYATYFADNQ